MYYNYNVVTTINNERTVISVSYFHTILDAGAVRFTLLGKTFNTLMLFSFKHRLLVFKTKQTAQPFVGNLRS